MDTNIWAKTILSTYRYLERIADAIDAMVESSGLHSRNVSGSNFTNNNILNLAERLIDLSERKVKLINLKILTEKSLEKCGTSYSKLLIAKYLDGKTNTEIAEQNNLPYRTYFKRLNEAEIRFEMVMARNGFNKENLEKYLSTERWIMEVKNRIQNLRSRKEFNICESRLDRLAVS